jgi:hypothetical protein
MAVTHFMRHALLHFLSLVTLFTFNVQADGGIITFPITAVAAPGNSSLTKRQPVAGPSEFPVTLVNEQTLYLITSMPYLRLAPNRRQSRDKH